MTLPFVHPSGESLVARNPWLVLPDMLGLSAQKAANPESLCSCERAALNTSFTGPRKQHPMGGFQLPASTARVDRLARRDPQHFRYRTTPTAKRAHTPALHAHALYKYSATREI